MRALKKLVWFTIFFVIQVMLIEVKYFAYDLSWGITLIPLWIWLFYNINTLFITYLIAIKSLKKEGKQK